MWQCKVRRVFTAGDTVWRKQNKKKNFLKTGVCVHLLADRLDPNIQCWRECFWRELVQYRSCFITMFSVGICIRAIVEIWGCGALTIFTILLALSLLVAIQLTCCLWWLCAAPPAGRPVSVWAPRGRERTTQEVCVCHCTWGIVPPALHTSPRTPWSAPED